MKKLIAICISLIMVLASVCLCFADGLYEIDSQTGQVVGAPEGDATEVNLVRLTVDCAYNLETGMYIYTAGNNSVSDFSCSIYNGMYTTKSVDLKADPTALLKVYCNGEELEFTGDDTFNKDGAYIVRDKENNQILGFSIIPTLTNSISSYHVPSVFAIESVTVNDENVVALSNDISMSEDGAYVIKYFSYDTGVSYTLAVNIDHTAPELEIIGLNEEGYARNKVTFGDTEYASTLTVYLEGEEYDYYTALTDAGDYEVHYTDEAGNTSIYDFTIRQYLDVNAWLAMVIAVLILIGVGAYMIYLRTHMRVR